MKTIESLPTHRSGWGGPANWNGLAKAEDIIAQQLTEMGYEPTLHGVKWKPPRVQEDAPHLWPDWHNIIVEIPGKTKADEVLIIGAHYDAVPGAPGADDNGTGVAALMAIARILKDRPMERTIRLIFFTLEEPGLVGSRQQAAWYQQNVLWEKKEDPIGMISLDMLGYFSDEPGSQISPIQSIEGVFEAPTVADFIGMATIAQHSEFIGRLNAEMLEGSPDLKTVVVDFLPIPTPDLLRSDHAPYLAIGVPAVIIADTANFRNPNYHQPTDTIDTINKPRYTDVVKGLVHAAWQIAGPIEDKASGSDEGAKRRSDEGGRRH